jgi:hypothetical protein
MRASTRAVTEEIRGSLAERISAMHRLWGFLTKDLTAEHANHFERSGVLPIAFTLTHAIPNEDGSVAMLLGGEFLWDAHADRVGLSGKLPRRGTPMEQAERTRIRDIDAWRAYQLAVFERTERAVAEASLERLADRHEITPQALRGGYLELLVGTPERVRVMDALEAWVYQHGIRHAGELEHARALVGLQGVT